MKISDSLLQHKLKQYTSILQKSKKMTRITRNSTKTVAGEEKTSEENKDCSIQ